MCIQCLFPFLQYGFISRSGGPIISMSCISMTCIMEGHLVDTSVFTAEEMSVFQISAHKGKQKNISHLCFKQTLASSC